MLIQVLVGCGVIVLNLGIQIWAVDLVLRFLKHDTARHLSQSVWRVLSGVMLFLLLGHLLQFATWAVLFLLLGEFGDIETAYYHSIVNFTSLGYGDIVMSEDWRLLGALEAANGVLMFGLTAGLLLTVFSQLVRQRPQFERPLDPGASEEP